MGVTHPLMLATWNNGERMETSYYLLETLPELDDLIYPVGRSHVRNLTTVKLKFNILKY